MIRSNKKYEKPSSQVLKEKLSPMEYEVTQNDATEPPFRNRFWDNHDEGLYVDVATGEPLFSSRDKFDSGTGWPSFTQPIEKDRVKEKSDATHGMVRVEVRSSAGDSHLGHVFPDGPRPSGMRYCINSASLRFIPKKDLAQEGYGDYVSLFGGQTPASIEDGERNSCATPAPGEKAGCESTLETVVVAGGCFWGMEEIIRAIPGVIETEVGYAGGSTERPSYETVKRGNTGHAESVRVVFDPKKLSLSDFLEKWFFRMHDPTTLNRQGNDVGTQYRSAIFYESEEQKSVALAVKDKLDKSGRFKKPITTEIAKAGEFTDAEDFHQDYLQKHPGGYTCHFLRDETY